MDDVSSRRGTRSAVALGASVAAAVVLAACGAPDRPAASGLEVVATTSILGDLARNVVGDAGTVTVVVPPGADPHGFQLSAGEGRVVQEADLVVANGLGLEGALLDVVDAAEEGGTAVLHVAEHVDPLPAGGEGEHADGDDGHGHGELDPHFWHDPLRVVAAVEVLADDLAELAPDVADEVRANARAYAGEVRDLHDELERRYATIPPERRVLVTEHDSFRYLAERYGFAVLGTIVPGGSTLADTSPAELAGLAAAIEDVGVPAVFVEEGTSTRLAEVLETEAGVAVVPLFSDALGDEGSAAETYVELARTNADRIVGALTEVA